MGSRSHWLLLLAPLAYGCGGEGDLLPPNELPFETPAPTDGAVADGSSGDGGSKPTSVKKDGGVSEEDPLTEDNSCAASSLAAEQVVVQEEVVVEIKTTTPAPVALYVMLDRSTSMALSLWNPAVKALTSFVRDQDSSGMDIATQYFPNGGGSCNGNGYSTPAVALGRLPQHADAVVASLEGQNPGGIGTPIEGALRGATQYCKNFQATNAKERCVAVLVTDGKPEWDGCEKDDAKLTAIAAEAWNNSQVRTFAVGLSGADFTLLDKIAKAGGAADCDPNSARFSCDVSSGADKLSVALAKIRDTVTTVETHTELKTELKSRPLECEWHMPQPSGEQAVDIERVNVTLSGGSHPPLELGRVPGAASCQPGAWYFDDPSAPTRIIACPESCQSIATGGYTDVKILLGCDTHILVI